MPRFIAVPAARVRQVQKILFSFSYPRPVRRAFSQDVSDAGDVA